MKPCFEELAHKYQSVISSYFITGLDAWYTSHPRIVKEHVISSLLEDLLVNGWINFHNCDFNLHVIVKVLFYGNFQKILHKEINDKGLYKNYT